MIIRAYGNDDFENTVKIIESNQVKYFMPSDITEFSLFLEEGPDHFYVGTLNAEIVACGGFWFPGQTQASLTWGMVLSSSHGRGFGSQMLKHRIELIKKYGAKEIVCSTSQLTERFFAKHGFIKQSQEPDGYGPNIDEIILTLSL